MKVVLLETISHLGSVGDVISVRSGYARNFLFPKKHAILADERNVKAAEHKKRLAQHKLEKAKDEAQSIISAVSKETLVTKRKAGQDDKLFGSVTSGDIEALLAEKGYKVSRRSIQLETPIKKVGVFPIVVRLAGGLEATVQLKVLAEKEKVEAQATETAEVEEGASSRSPKRGKGRAPKANDADTVEA